MSKPNLQFWEELSTDLFLKTAETAARHFRDMARFPDSVGFDDESQGFLAIHKRHSPSGFATEIPVCEFLKRKGFRVILQDESPEKRLPDCKINDLDFEIKQIAQTKSIHKAIVNQARKGYSKCNRLLFDIRQPANLKQLEGGIIDSLNRYKSLRTIWVVKDKKHYIFDFDSKKLKGTAR